MAKRLTRSQNRVLNCLQNGFTLEADDFKGATVSHEQYGSFRIMNRLLVNLIDQEFIYQNHWPPYDYLLTDKGLQTKTTEVYKTIEE